MKNLQFFAQWQRAEDFFLLKNIKNRYCSEKKVVIVRIFI